MNRVALSSAILFPLVIFFVMQYRLSPGDTPYILFGIIFLLLLGYIVADLLIISQKTYSFIKTTLLFVVIAVVLGSGFYSSMVVRHETAPIYGVHDIILQQEAAIRYVIHGKNPYKETYFGTPMQAWHYSDTEVNPALYHFVMEPVYLVFPLPFYIISNHTLGYFDSREVLWLLFGVLLVTAYFVPKEGENKRLLVTLLAFNPAMLGYTLEGRSDIFAYAFLFLGFFLLQKKKLFWAGVPIALSFATKQSTWLFIPLYFLFVFHYAFKEKKTIWERGILFVKNISSFLLVAAICIIPFYLWDPKAFLASTVYYLSGNVVHSYPISGYGFGMVLNQLGFIKDVHMYYPFQLWQLGIGLPVLVLLAWYFWKKPTVSKLIVCYGLFLFVFWYFARYFNNSHVGYLSLVFITAYLWPDEEKKITVGKGQ
jgi:hypothetical protein